MMRFYKILFFLITLASISGQAIEMRLYSCTAKDIDVSLYIDSTEEQEHWLDIEIRGIRVRAKVLEFQKQGDALLVNGFTKTFGQVAITVFPPLNKVMANDRGLVDYQIKFQSALRLGEGDSSYTVECEVYDFQRSYFDQIFSRFP